MKNGRKWPSSLILFIIDPTQSPFELPWNGKNWLSTNPSKRLGAIAPLISGLLDYPVVITQPMDLGTVKTKLKTNKYTTLSQVGTDVNRIWTNCKEYNRVGSDFHKLAGSLQRKWDDKYTKLLAECKTIGTGGDVAGDVKEGESSKPAPGSVPPGPENAQKTTLAERRTFAKALFNLTKEDVGKILVDVEAKCPEALVRNASEDEVELNVDKIPQGLLKELDQFINTAQKKKKPASNKRAKTSK